MVHSTGITFVSIYQIAQKFNFIFNVVSIYKFAL